ncbi:MAG: serine hydrolase [Bacteroidetes bacterium]|nr:serine hydrolase [Bacteroidota bacterium]
MSTKWVGTWSTAPQLVEPGNNPPAPGLSNNTLRQVVRVSIGGKSVRLRLTNEFSTTPVTFHAVHIALSKGGSAIDSSTDRLLSFDGETETTVAPGAAITSDPIPFRLQPRADIAITIHYGDSPADITGHPGSRTTSYLLSGNEASRTVFSGAITTDHWYNINAIDVLAPSSAACVAILGNSITDGRGSTTNKQDRWTDVFSESLLKDSSTQHVGVLNLGIGGNCVLSGGLGPTGASRFDRDIRGQHTVRWAVVFEGVNDIGKVKSVHAASLTATNLIAAYQMMIAKAHAKNIRIYGITILPFNGHSYFNQYSELCRSLVNAWIRTKGNFDGCIDFDRVMRNPLDTTRLVSTYQNDGLHPDAASYKKMGESIDRSMFAGSDSVFHQHGGLESNWSEAERAQIDSLMSSIYRSRAPGAAIGVIKDGKVVFSKGYGIADLDSGAPVRPSTNFNICSMTKQFTAYGVLQLAKEGRLSLDDKLDRFFPKLAPGVAKRVSVRQLLTHSSGIVDHYAHVDRSRHREFWDRDVLAAISAIDTGYFSPGSQYRYSNTAYCLLSLIIEQLSGDTYPAYLGKRVFAPLNMVRSGVIQPEFRIADRALGYESEKDTFTIADAKQSLFFSTMGDGGMYTSINDYLKWITAIQQSQVLDPGLVGAAQSPQFPIDTVRNIWYGFGWFVAGHGDSRLVYHTGSNGGFRTIVLTKPSAKYAVIIFSNRTGVDLEDLVRVINRICGIDDAAFVKLESLIS